MFTFQSGEAWEWGYAQFWRLIALQRAHLRESVLISGSTNLSLVPRPLPPEERPGTHCLHMHEIFCFIFRKKLCALPCPYAEDYTNQEYRVFIEIHSSNDLTYRTMLGYFSKVPASFFRKVKNRFTKKGWAVSSHTSSHRNTYLSSYTICSGSALNTICLLQQKHPTIQR